MLGSGRYMRGLIFIGDKSSEPRRLSSSALIGTHPSECVETGYSTLQSKEINHRPEKNYENDLRNRFFNSCRRGCTMRRYFSGTARITCDARPCDRPEA